MSNWGRDRRDSRDEPPRQQSFANRGVLFGNQNKRSDNSPDYTGNVVIGEDVLDYILREAERGGEVKLDLSGWRRISRDNTNFTSISIAIPYSVRMEEQGNPTYRSRPGPQRRDDRHASPQPQRRSSSYAEQSGRSDRRYDERNPPPRDDVPDFMRDDDDDAPPF